MIPACFSFTRAGVFAAAIASLASAASIPDRPVAAFPLEMVVPADEKFQRRSEASSIVLKSGNVLLLWCDLVGSSDNAKGYIAGQELTPDGRTIGQPRLVFPTPEGGLNTLSPAVRRLKDGSIGVAFSYRMSTKVASRRFSVSRDEGATWSQPVVVSDGSDSYMTGCNDRLTVLASGRLVAPLHCSEDWEKHHLHVKVAFSDDHGATWRMSGSKLELPYVRWQDRKIGLESGPHEPGVAERADGTLLMTMRTPMGTQFYSESQDRGETWSGPRSLELISPLAPANLTRIPGTNKLLMVWTPNYDAAAGMMGRRNTIMACISDDGGRTWPHGKRKVLIHDPARSIDYPSVMYRGDEVWISLRVSSGPGVLQGRTGTGLMRVPLRWFE